MSQQIHHVPAARFEFAPRLALWLVGLLVAAAIATSVVLIANNGNDSSTATVTPASTSISGPNESLRGQAAHSATGAQSSASGPNESLRGQAAAGATR
jgi:hypothetical protein